MNTSPTTVRIPKEKLEKIDGLCKKTGSCRNSWINSAIDVILDNCSEYDFGLEEDEEMPENHPKVVLDDEREDQFKSHHDSFGNLWKYDKDRKIWVCHIEVNNVRAV